MSDDDHITGEGVLDARLRGGGKKNKQSKHKGNEPRLTPAGGRGLEKKSTKADRHEDRPSTMDFQKPSRPTQARETHSRRSDRGNEQRAANNNRLRKVDINAIGSKSRVFIPEAVLALMKGSKDSSDEASDENQPDPLIDFQLRSGGLGAGQRISPAAGEATGVTAVTSDNSQCVHTAHEDEAASNRNVDVTKRAYGAMLQRILSDADVLLEVLDARDPLGCRQRAGGRLREKRLHAGYSGESFGAPELVQALKGIAKGQLGFGGKGQLTVGVIGYPNVGKSSVINSLVRSKAAQVGDRAGVTKHTQTVRLDKSITVIDCPGVVLDEEQDESKQLLRNCLPVDKALDVISPVAEIVRRCGKEPLCKAYGLDDFRDHVDLLSAIAQRRGKLLKGGGADQEAAARAVLQDWNRGRLKYHTLPPEADKFANVLESTVVDKLGPAFQLDLSDPTPLPAAAGVDVACPAGEPGPGASNLEDQVGADSEVVAMSGQPEPDSEVLSQAAAALLPGNAVQGEGGGGGEAQIRNPSVDDEPVSSM